MRNLLLASTLLAAVGASPAHAALQIAADINGAGFFCANGQACDQNSNPNVIITNNANLDGILFSSSSTSSASSKTQDFLNSSNLVITNTNSTAVAVTITVSNTDFTAPVKSFTTADSGVWQGSSAISTATMKWFVDPLDRQGADNAFNTPGDLIEQVTSTSAGPLLAFSQNDPDVPDGLDGPFSMTEQITIVLQPGESLVNRGQSIVGIPSAIPETSTWMMMAIGLAFMGFAGHRRHRNRLATFA
jgi:hypothetical protein